MTDSQENNTKDSRRAQTINIEVPAGCFEGMISRMTGRGGFGKAGSGCCETTQDRGCPPSKEDEGREFNIVIKMKE